MTKRILFLTLTATMIGLLAVPKVVLGHDYTEHWAKETIQIWFDRDRIEGYEDGSFKPDNSITRAEFMTMVNRAYDFEEITEIEYSDALVGEWYYIEVQKAVKSGYIVGDDEDRVRPLSEVTRQEVAAVITRLNDIEKSTDVLNFADKEQIAPWALEFVGAVKKAGYMLGDDNEKFNPTKNITRAEALVTLDRAMKDREWNAYSINEMSIEGAKLLQRFRTNTTNYSATVNEGVHELIIIADVASDAEITFALNGKELEKITANAVEGGNVYTASVKLTSDHDVVTMDVSNKGLKDRVYTITLKR